MTHDKIEALWQLIHNHGLTIKPADKGLAVVIMHRAADMNDAYKCISYETTFEIERRIKGIVDEAFESQLIDKKLQELLFNIQSLL